MSLLSRFRGLFARKAVRRARRRSRKRSRRRR